MFAARSSESILLPYQLRAVRIGVQATWLVVAGMVLYPLLPGGPEVHLAGYLSTIVIALIGAVGVHFLPWRRIFEAGHGPVMLYGWSIGDILLISVAIVFSGGQQSDVAIAYLLTTVFFAASYPLRGQFMLFGFTVFAYLAVLWAVEPAWNYAALVYWLVALVTVMFMCSFLSRELSQQMRAHDSARTEAERRSALLSEVWRSSRELHGASAARVLQVTADTARRLGFDYAAIAVGRPGEESPELLCLSGRAGPHDEEQPRSLESLPHSLLRLVLPFQTEAGRDLSLLLFSERAEAPGTAEREALDFLLSRATRALDAAEHSEEIARRERHFRSLLEHSSDLITVLDASGRITYQSNSSRELLGAAASPTLSDPFEANIHPGDRDMLANMLTTTLAYPSPTPERTQVRIHTSSGWKHIEIIATNRIDDPAVRGIVLNGRDVSDHVRLADQLRNQALHDPLTGLPNRTLLASRLDEAIAARTPGRSVGLLFVDLDDFKRVNDLFGHAAGDRFLTRAAHYFESALGPNDTVARFGGDEFVLVLTDVGDPVEVERKAESLIAGLGPSLFSPDQSMTFTASAGIVLVGHEDRVTAEEILYRADIAMYHAKRRGKARYAIFDDEMAAVLVSRHGLEVDLRAAIAQEEFEVYYQPLVTLLSGAITGVEALVRWQHPRRGLLSPAEFLPLADELGLMPALGRIVLRKAIAQFSSWRHEHAGLGQLRLNVNIAPDQLRDPKLIEELEHLLQEHALPPELLVLEMTEAALAGEVSEAAEALTQLKALGVRIAVDDFGTGYSSLTYLHAFPLDILKIDRSFVMRLGSSDGETLVSAIVDLAARLNLEATAEGIESEAQLQYLKSRGCALGQGFLLARPVPAAEVLELLLADASGTPLTLRRPA